MGGISVRSNSSSDRGFFKGTLFLYACIHVGIIVLLATIWLMVPRFKGSSDHNNNNNDDDDDDGESEATEEHRTKGRGGRGGEEGFVSAPTTLHRLSSSSSSSNSREKTVAQLQPFGRVRCVVINLARNAERMSRIQSSYQKSDLSSVLSMQRIEAVDATKLPDINKFLSPRARVQLAQTIQTGYRTRHGDITVGAVGCFLSHITVMRMLIEDADADVYFVLEDDANIPEDLVARLPREPLPDNWGILVLGTHYQVNWKGGGDLSAEIPKTYQKLQIFWGTHAYFITRAAAQKFVDNYLAKRIMQQIDSQISIMAIRNEIDIYAVRPALMHTFSEDTDVQMPIREMNSVNPYDLLEGFLNRRRTAHYDEI